MTQTGKPQIPAGDTFKLNFDVVGADGLPAALAGATVRWAMAAKAVDPAPLLTKTSADGITLDNDVLGRFVVSLSSDDTDRPAGDYFHQATVSFADGTVSTVLRAYLTILETLLP